MSEMPQKQTSAGAVRMSQNDPKQPDTGVDVPRRSEKKCEGVLWLRPCWSWGINPHNADGASGPILGNQRPPTRFLTTDWTASIPPQAVPADIKAKTSDPAPGFLSSGSSRDVTLPRWG